MTARPSKRRLAAIERLKGKISDAMDAARFVDVATFAAHAERLGQHSLAAACRRMTRAENTADLAYAALSEMVDR
jgi:hypothetical protein